MYLHAEVTVGVAEQSYSVEETQGFVEVSYVLNSEVFRNVTFHVINIDGTATGGLGEIELTDFAQL